jgi:putative nucleotidyltransferase with HDIG domain
MLPSIAFRHETLHDLLTSQPQDLHQHSHAVAQLAGDLAQYIGRPFSEQESIRTGSLLHDIGKQFIPASILNKQGALSDAEYSHVREHVWLGYSYLTKFVSDGVLLNTVLYHHERWDGTGYPFGMAGDHIPLGGRICALVDVWDALVTDRCYHRAWSMTRAAEFIWAHAGTAFDPDLAHQFLNMLQAKFIDGSLSAIKTSMLPVTRPDESSWVRVPISVFPGGRRSA